LQEEEKGIRDNMIAQERVDSKCTIMFKNITKYINEEQIRVNTYINNYGSGISKTLS